MNLSKLESRSRRNTGQNDEKLKVSKAKSRILFIEW